MIRLLTNEKLTNHYPSQLDITNVAGLLQSGSLFSKTVSLFKALRNADAYLAFNPSATTFLAGFLHKVAGGNARLILWDTLLPKPRGPRGHILAWAKCFLFRRIDYFFCVHRNTVPYERHYGIAKRKFRYIPFKANNYEMLDSFPVEDGGYILSCGASYRDFDCLMEAVRNIAVPTKIVLPSRSIAEHHNTYFRVDHLPENVTVIEHDMNKRSWNEYLSRATAVVIPITKDCIQPAGISVYLEAMALGKPVIISKGASTEQILDESMAMLFEAGDSQQLQKCILALLESKELREQLSRSGREYALSLGGEVRLVKDLERQVICLFGKGEFCTIGRPAS